MTADFLKYFYSDKFNDKIILKNNGEKYTVADIKKLVCAKRESLKTINSESFAIGDCSNFEFIIDFLSCIFSGKNIFLFQNVKNINIPDTTKIKPADIKSEVKPNFPKINASEITITLFTSGSVTDPKKAEKNLRNLINEAKDLQNEFCIHQNYEFISTISLNHLFGLTFQFFLPLNSGCIINTDRISYPEHINVNDACLVTTPSILEKIEKYGELPPAKPRKIISAGSKFKDKTFTYALSISDEVIDIYGSSETGIIAYRKKPTDNFKCFKNVTINTLENGIEITTPYSRSQTNIIGDKIELLPNNEIKLLGRFDRILKIQEKRLAAQDVENILNQHEFVEKSYIFQSGEKLGCLTVLNKYGIEKFLNSGIVELIKILKNYLNNHFKIVPQKWKFIDEIPLKSNGKIDKTKIESLFNINLSLPLILEKECFGNSANIKLYFYHNCNFFKGHFTGFPIVPGLVQLFYAQYFAKDLFDIDCTAGQIRKTKFSNIIQPDTIVYLKLDLDNGKICYKYYDDSKDFSSGILPAHNILENAK